MAAEDIADVQIIEADKNEPITENELDSPDHCRAFLERFLHERPADPRDPAAVSDAALLLTMFLKKPDIQRQLSSRELRNYERRAQAVLDRYYPERIYGMCANNLELSRRSSSGNPVRDAELSLIVLRGVDAVLLQVRNAQKLGVPLDLPQIYQKISVFTEAALHRIPGIVQDLKSGNHSEEISDLAAQVDETARTFKARRITFDFDFPDTDVFRQDAEKLASIEIFNARN